MKFSLIPIFNIIAFVCIINKNEISFTNYMVESGGPTSSDVTASCVTAINAKRQTDLKNPLTAVASDTSLDTALATVMTSMTTNCAIPATVDNVAGYGELMFEGTEDMTTCVEAVADWYGTIENYKCTYPNDDETVRGKTKPFDYIMASTATGIKCSITDGCATNEYVVCHLKPKFAGSPEDPFTKETWALIIARDKICSGFGDEYLWPVGTAITLFMLSYSYLSSN